MDFIIFVIVSSDGIAAGFQKNPDFADKQKRTLQGLMIRCIKKKPNNCTSRQTSPKSGRDGRIPYLRINGVDCDFPTGDSISKLCEEERLQEAIQAVEFVHQQGLFIPSGVICCLLQGCNISKNLAAGRRVHSLSVSTGYSSVAFLGDHLIRLFSSCGTLFEANQAFGNILEPSLYTWDALLSAHAKLVDGRAALWLYCKMQQEGVKPNKVIFLCILKACSSTRALGQGRLIHDQIIQSGLESVVVIGNTLLNMYVKCESFLEACKLFDKLPNRDVVSWGALIAGYAQHGLCVHVSELFETMQKEGIEPNEVILNILLDMYAKHGNLKTACKVFEELPNRDVVSWGTMISGYAQHGQGLFALELYERMHWEGVQPNKFIFSGVLNACGSIKDTRKARLIHDEIMRSGLGLDVIVGNALIDTYSKCGNLDEASEVFDNLLNRDLVSWGAMIAAYVQHGHYFSALKFFEEMQIVGMKPNNVLFSCTLKACGCIGALGQGRLIHEQLMRNGLESNLVIGSALLDLYAKCGILEEACKVFDGLSDRDEKSWGAMIAGYARYGNFGLTVQCLEDMRQDGLMPDDVIFASVLAACSHTGLVDEGCQFFNLVTEEHGITPKVVHYNCMVDLLGRAGCLNKAEDLLQSIPVPLDTFGWMSLLTGCRTYGNMVLGSQCFKQILWLDPNYASGYMCMLSIYVDAHMRVSADNTQELRKCTIAMKKPGRAWMEVNNRPHELVVGDKSHLRSPEIYAKLKILKRPMVKEGLVPSLD